jgi:hypothetical protein
MAAPHWRTALTIFGTPYGTSLNATGFQGTQPGNAVQASLQVVSPGVGLFPPNSNNASGDSVLASASRATLPLNAQGSGYGVTSAAGTGAGSGGRTMLNALSDGDRNGTNAQVGVDSLNSDANGGQSLGAGGANQTEGPSSGVSSVASTQQPVNTLALQGGAVPIFGG